MRKNKTLKQFVILFSGIIITLGLSLSLNGIIAATWQAPSSAPPNNNLYDLLNTGPTDNSGRQVVWGDFKTFTLNATSTVDFLNDLTVDGNFIVDTTLAPNQPTLFVDSANHRVGIGTLAPVAGYKLDVAGNINFSGDLYKGGVLSQYLDDSDFSSNGLMVRTGAGTYATRSLIGTANKITVADSDGATDNPTISLPSTVYLGTSGRIGRDANNLLDFSTNNQITFRANSANQMLLNASGNLNIGSPANTTKKLNIGGEVSAAGYCNADITECRTIDELIAVGGGGSGTVNSGLAGQVAYYASDGTAVSGTSSLMLDGSGKVKIGDGGINANDIFNVTSPKDAGGNNLLDVLLDVDHLVLKDDSAQIVFDVSTSAHDWNITAIDTHVATYDGLFFDQGTWDPSASPSWSKKVAGQEPLLSLRWDIENIGINTRNPQYKLHVAGTAGKPGGGSWADSSDIRLKKNIYPLNNALDKILRLNAYEYEWINPDLHSKGRHVGIMAQDLEKIFPAWVEEASPDGKDKDLLPEGEKIKTVHYPHDFNAYLVEAIKELKAEKDTEIEELKEQNVLLKAALCEFLPDNDICE